MMRQGLERRLLAANEQLKQVGNEKHNLSLLKDKLEKVSVVSLYCSIEGFGMREQDHVPYLFCTKQ